MYWIDGYGEMIADRARTDAYAEALRATVGPDSVVLDIGTGTGILAFLACRLGARKVYAVEPGDIIQLARQAAAANGFADRIEFIKGISTEIELPAKADVIVSDIRGILPCWETSLPSLIDARQRFLAPGGRLIPQKETLWVALVEAAESYRQVAEPWDSQGYGLDLQAIRDVSVNCYRKLKPGGHTVISEPRCWATLDYRTLTGSNVRGEAAWTLEREATAHGLAAWFDSELIDGVGFSNSPASPIRLIYGQAFFPFTHPVQLAAGDCVAVEIRADLIGGDYQWGWNTDVTSGSDPSVAAVSDRRRRSEIDATVTSVCDRPHRLASFRQSTLGGALLSPELLRKRAMSFVPALNADGQIDRAILQQMADGLSLDQIARNVVAQFPLRFPTRRQALNHVAELSAKYSR